MANGVVLPLRSKLASQPSMTALNILLSLDRWLGQFGYAGLAAFIIDETKKHHGNLWKWMMQVVTNEGAYIVAAVVFAKAKLTVCIK